MRSISFVSTQMQLINCIEAINHYKCDYNILLIVSTDKSIQRGINHLLEITNSLFRFDEVIVPFKDSHSGLFGGLLNVYDQQCQLKRLARQIQCDIFFSPNFKQAQQKYFIKEIFKINKDVKIILVDDGLAVCEIISRRNNELKKGVSDTHYVSRAYKLVYAIYVKRFVPNCIEFFTIYKNISISPSDSIVYNNYDFIRSHKIGLPVVDQSKIVVLGQPLVEARTLGLEGFTAEIYSSYIEKAVTFLGYRVTDVVYYPHPAEDVSISLSTSLRTSFSINIPEIPVELILIQMPLCIPILGFYTSALVNIKDIDNKRNVYSIYFDDFKHSTVERIRNVVGKAYKYIESKEIPVLLKD